MRSKSSKRKKKQDTELKHANGELSEDMFRENQILMGNTVTRRNQRKGGWDYTVQKRNILGEPIGRKLHYEVKSNRWNKQTKRQKLQKAKDKHYRRVNMNIDSIPGSRIFVDGKILERRYRKAKWL